MDNRFYSTDDNGLPGTYLESSGGLLTDYYGRYLNVGQVAEVLRESIESLPAMEREAVVATYLRNAEDFDWGGLVKTVAPLIGGAIAGPAGAVAGSFVGNMVGQSNRPSPPARNTPARKSPVRKTPVTQTSTAQSPEPPPEPTVGQITAIVNNPQFLQALKQALGISGSATAPAPATNANAEPKESYGIYPEATTYDPRYWYYDSKSRQWRRRPSVTPPVRSNYDPRYWYYDTKSGQWRRRPGTIPPAAPSPDPRYYYFDKRYKRWLRRPAPQSSPVTAPAAGHPSLAGQPTTYPPVADLPTAYPPQTDQPPLYPTNDFQFPAYPVSTDQPLAYPPPLYSPLTGQSAEQPTHPAVSQLIALMNSPQFSQALLGQVLGDMGNGNATVQQGNELVDIPFGALMNTLVELGQQAAEESVRGGAAESERYLLDNEGNYRVNDPSNPEERAKAVMEILREDYEWRNSNTAAPTEAAESYDPVTEWLISAGMVN